MILFKLLMLLLLPFTLMFGLNSTTDGSSLGNTSIVGEATQEGQEIQGQQETATEGIQNTDPSRDEHTCSSIESCVNAALANEEVYKQSAKRGKTWSFYVKVNEKAEPIIDGLANGEEMFDELKEMLKGMKNPATQGMNSYMITVDVKASSEVVEIGNVKVELSEHDFKTDNKINIKTLY